MEALLVILFMLAWVLGAFFFTGLFNGNNSKESLRTAIDVTKWWSKMVIALAVLGIFFTAVLGINL